MTTNRIDDLIAADTAYVDNLGRLIGIASDGIEVDLASTEDYLEAHPTPDTW